jgi:hypothetical protein
MLSAQSGLAMLRREFLSAAGASATAPQLFNTGNQMDFDQDVVGSEILNRLTSWIGKLAALGLDGTRQVLVESANAIAPPYLEARNLHLDQLEAVDNPKTVFVNAYETVQSIVGTLNSRLGLDIPWMRIGAGFGRITSIGGILISLAAIGNAAVPLSRASMEQGLAPEKISMESYRDYVFAILGLGIELAFIAVPFSYRFAWRGTRYIATRTLFRVRKFLPKYRDGITALTMIVLHWAQRLGVELLLANLQLATDAAAAGVEELQRLGRDFTLGDASEFESGALWDIDQKNLRAEMVRLVEKNPEVRQVAGEGLLSAVQTE